MALLGCVPPATADDDDGGSCEAHKDCQGGEICEDGECVAVAGEACEEDRDCDGGEVCQDDVCVPAAGACTPVSSECTVSTECCDYDATPALGASACVNFAGDAACAHYCEQSSDCASDCCVQLEDEDIGACGAPEFCEGGADTGTTDPTDSESVGDGTGTTTVGWPDSASESSSVGDASTGGTTEPGTGGGGEEGGDSGPVPP